MGPVKIHDDGKYAHAQDSNAYNFWQSQNSANLIRTFIGQFLKGNSMGPIKIQNGGNYAHAQDSNAYNFCLELKFSYTYKNVHRTVFEGQ